MKEWKIRREFGRIAQRLQGLVTAPFEAAARVRRSRSFELSLLDDRLASCRKVAIYVIYQPAGLSESTLATARYLVRCQYEVIVISNAPLLLADRQGLAAVTSAVFERPNFGYDFGAYQEAILSLGPKLEDLDALLLINDSVWLPFLTGGDPLRDMESLPLDVVAAQIFGEKHIRQRPGKLRHPILGSYFLLFRNRALNHEAFRRFWREYRMSSNKEITIRRGERELSRCLYASELLCGAWLDNDRFVGALSRLPVDRLRLALEELVCLSPGVVARRTELLTAGTDRASEMRQLLFDVSETKNMIGSSPLLCLEHLRSAVFVKKNNEMLYRLARQRIARALREGRLPDADPVMAAELLMRAEVDSGRRDLREAEMA